MVGLSIKFLIQSAGASSSGLLSQHIRPPQLLLLFLAEFETFFFFYLASCFYLSPRKNFFLKFGQTNFIKIAKNLYNNGNPGGASLSKIHFVHLRQKRKVSFGNFSLGSFFPYGKETSPRKRFAFPRTNTFIIYYIIIYYIIIYFSIIYYIIYNNKNK